jgi:endoglucanase
MMSKNMEKPHSYEIYNEPDRETWPEVSIQAVIKAIRLNDPDNIILVGCGAGCSSRRCNPYTRG